MTQLMHLKGPAATAELGRIMGDLISEIFSGLDLTEKTRSQYEREVRRFARWVEEEGWSSDVLIRFKNHLRGDLSLTTNTKSKYLTVARLFVERLAALGLVPFEVEAPKGFKTSRGHKRQPLTKADVARILAEVEGDAFLNTVVHFLYFQGLRGNEVRNLEVDDLQLANEGFFVSGKGRDGDKEWVRFHPQTLQAVKSYLGETQLGSGFLFPSAHGSGRPISQSTIWRRLKKVFTKLGIDSNPHAFRKSFVSGLIEGGVDLITVSQFSRHRSIHQLQTYYDRVSVEKSFPQFVEALALTWQANS